MLTDSITQPTPLPTRKVAAGTLAAAVSVLAVWVLGIWVDVPAEVASALTTVLGFVAAYLIPDRALH
jgi:putative flippase GtrA